MNSPVEVADLIARSIAAVAAAIVVAFGSYLVRRFLFGPKVIYYLGQASTFTLTAPSNPVVRTHVFFVANVGKTRADNVRVGHSSLPKHFLVSPKEIGHRVDKGNGSDEIVFPTLHPKEQVMISYLYSGTQQWHDIHLYTRCDQCVVAKVEALTAPLEASWIRWGRRILFWLGIFAIIYVAFLKLFESTLVS